MNLTKEALLSLDVSTKSLSSDAVNGVESYEKQVKTPDPHWPYLNRWSSNLNKRDGPCTNSQHQEARSRIVPSPLGLLSQTLSREAGHGDQNETRASADLIFALGVWVWRAYHRIETELQFWRRDVDLRHVHRQGSSLWLTTPPNPTETLAGDALLDPREDACLLLPPVPETAPRRLNGTQLTAESNSGRSHSTTPSKNSNPPNASKDSNKPNGSTNYQRILNAYNRFIISDIHAATDSDRKAENQMRLKFVDRSEGKP
ncbi:hypothetical protein Bca101_091606 [Brassica carinata]